MPNSHVRSVVPNPWDPAAPTWYIVGMFDMMFPTREILQPRPDTSYVCWNCCSLPVRACSPTRIPRRHVRSDVSYAWDPAAPLWYLVCMLELLFLILTPHRRVRSGVLNPWDPEVTSWYLVGMTICSSQSVRSCNPDLIPCRHVRSDVPYSWEPAAPSWYALGMYYLVFRTREILQPRPYTE